MSLIRKRLLILGANQETKKLGVYTIVTDYLQDSPAKKVADKSYDIDGLNVSELVAIAKQENIDGVLVGVADLLISTYQQVCEQLALPCYATTEQVDIFTNKYNFKRKCEEYGIRGVPEYDISNGNYSNIKCPAIIKPVDSNSGKGISLCRRTVEIPAAIEKAEMHSTSKRILAERYMACADVSIYYTFKDGKVYLSSIDDRYTCKEQGELSPVCLGDIFPSKLLNLFLEDTHKKFCRMFEDLGMENGILYISAFYENGEFYVYDPGFRLQGGGFHHILNAINGFDHRKMLINFALTGYMGEENLDAMNHPDMKGKSAAIIWLLLKAGTIKTIKGTEFIKHHPDIVHMELRFKEGDTIKPEDTGTERQVFSRLFIAADTRGKLFSDILDFKRSIEVTDTNGNSMLLETLDLHKALSIPRHLSSIYADGYVLKNKTIVISGGTKGVGRQLSIDCAIQGANVVIGGRDKKSAQLIIQQIMDNGGNAVFVYTDLHYADQCKKLFDEAVRCFGKIDGFVNYAGITPVASLVDCDEPTFDNIFDINVKSAFFCTQNAIRYMRENSGGSIVFVGSSHAWSGQKDRAAYALSKGTLLVLSEHIAHNYASENIRSNYLTLGWTPTDGELELRRSQGISENELKAMAAGILPMGSMATIEDPIPAFIYFLSDASSMVTGSNIRVTGGEYI
jgi:NAD(P)-dependent dehydrogenase (short-subunit alcohol dehydrogenase family)/biotin carboxylase